MRWIFIVALLAACTDPKEPPLCSDVGCPVGSPALCTRAGACTCDGVACRRDEIDAATAPAAFATGTETGDVDAGDHD